MEVISVVQRIVCSRETDYHPNALLVSKVTSPTDVDGHLAARFMLLYAQKHPQTKELLESVPIRILLEAVRRLDPKTEQHARDMTGLLLELLRHAAQNDHFDVCEEVMIFAQHPIIATNDIIRVVVSQIVIHTPSYPYVMNILDRYENLDILPSSKFSLVSRALDFAHYDTQLIMNRLSYDQYDYVLRACNTVVTFHKMTEAEQNEKIRLVMLGLALEGFPVGGKECIIRAMRSESKHVIERLSHILQMSRDTMMSLSIVYQEEATILDSLRPTRDDMLCCVMFWTLEPHFVMSTKFIDRFLRYGLAIDDILYTTVNYGTIENLMYIVRHYTVPKSAMELAIHIACEAKRLSMVTALLTYDVSWVNRILAHAVCNRDLKMCNMLLHHYFVDLEDVSARLLYTDAGNIAFLFRLCDHIPNEVKQRAYWRAYMSVLTNLNATSRELQV